MQIIAEIWTQEMFWNEQTQWVWSKGVLKSNTICHTRTKKQLQGPGRESKIDLCRFLDNLGHFNKTGKLTKLEVIDEG